MEICLKKLIDTQQTHCYQRERPPEHRSRRENPGNQGYYFQSSSSKTLHLSQHDPVVANIPEIGVDNGHPYRVLMQYWIITIFIALYPVSIKLQAEFIGN